MLFSVLADGVVLLHFVFIVFVCAGGLLALRFRWAPWLHIPAALWGVTVETFNLLCPLTPLENWLRAAAGQEQYATSFIDRYMTLAIYPPGLTRNWQVILGCALVAVNVVIYILVWRRRRSRAARR